jgi:hypothetical protein
MQRCRNGGHWSEIGCVTTQELQELEKRQKEKKEGIGKAEKSLYSTLLSGVTL